MSTITKEDLLKWPETAVETAWGYWGDGQSGDHAAVLYWEGDEASGLEFEFSAVPLSEGFSDHDALLRVAEMAELDMPIGEPFLIRDLRELLVELGWGSAEPPQVESEVVGVGGDGPRIKIEFTQEELDTVIRWMIFSRPVISSVDPLGGRVLDFLCSKTNRELRRANDRARMQDPSSAGFAYSHVEGVTKPNTKALSHRQGWSPIESRVCSCGGTLSPMASFNGEAWEMFLKCETDACWIEIMMDESCWPFQEGAEPEPRDFELAGFRVE